VLLATNQEAAEDSRAYNYGRIRDTVSSAEHQRQPGSWLKFNKIRQATWQAMKRLLNTVSTDILRLSKRKLPELL
jgi:hypothetical protein